MSELHRKPMNALSREMNTILDAIKIKGTLHWLGSSAIKEIREPNDFDFFNEIRQTTNFCKDIHDVIAKVVALPNTFVIELKLGIIPDWQIIPDEAYVKMGRIFNFNVIKARERLDTLWQTRVIDKSEQDSARQLLKDRMSVEHFLEARALLKFHQLRWTPKDIFQGFLEQRGLTFDLKDICDAKDNLGLVKLDLNSWLFGSRYVDISVIQHFRGTSIERHQELSLQEDILQFSQMKKQYKMLKRVFSLARFQKDARMIQKLLQLFNSDLGILGNVLADMDTIRGLLDLKSIRAISSDKIRFELDAFKWRLSYITTIPSIAKEDTSINAKIDAIQKIPSQTNSWSRAEVPIETLANDLNVILQRSTLKLATETKILPLPKRQVQ